MNQAIKERWLKALRSGEYEQAEGKLEDSQTGGFCCLGVLCTIAVKDEVVERIPDSSNKGILYAGINGEGYAFLPEDVQYWSEISSPDGEQFTVKEVLDLLPQEWLSTYYQGNLGKKITVADLNDEQVPFSVIADIIERVF